MTNLSDYTIRESQRAKHVNLKISVDGELEVVVPRGFDPGLIPDILNKKRNWITRTRERLAERQNFLKAQPVLPEELILRAINEVWQVEYQATTAKDVTVTEESDQRLIVRGKTTDLDLCRLALRQWLAQKAKAHLVPWLKEISRAEKLSFKKAIVRGQKTRWGSYSSKRTVSLNYKLLFLPPSLVRYVLIHELCHIKHMNHSKKFWALVKKKETGYRKAKTELRTAWRYVPGWLQES